MSVIARRIRATPERSATDTWGFIVQLISGSDSAARRELAAAGGVASCLIADETPKEAPIVVAGSGPRLRIYCLYGEDAITGDGSNETVLSTDPTAAEWTMWLPTPAEDVAWVRTELARCGKRIVAYDPKEEEAASGSTRESQDRLAVNIEAFRRL